MKMVSGGLRIARGTMEPTRRWRPRLSTAVALVLVLTAAACSGGDDSLVAESLDPSEASTTTSAGGAGAAPSESSSDGTDTIAQATVTIAGQTYRFREEGFIASANCAPSRDGTFRALLGFVDENGEPHVRSNLDLVLLHEGTDTGGSESNSIFVRLGHIEDDSAEFTPGWFAAAEFAELVGYDPGVSQVDSYAIDGNSVSGTATFVDNESDSAFARGDVDSVESVQGTFTVTCGG